MAGEAGVVGVIYGLQARLTKWVIALAPLDANGIGRRDRAAQVSSVRVLRVGAVGKADTHGADPQVIHRLTVGHLVPEHHGATLRRVDGVHRLAALLRLHALEVAVVGVGGADRTGDERRLI